MDLDDLARHARATQHVIRIHESRCPARNRPAPAAPEPLSLFAGYRVPYDTQIAMAERQSVSGWDSYQLSEEFGYPVEVVELVLSRLKGQYRRELMRRSSPWN